MYRNKPNSWGHSPQLFQDHCLSKFHQFWFDFWIPVDCKICQVFSTFRCQLDLLYISWIYRAIRHVLHSTAEYPKKSNKYWQLPRKLIISLFSFYFISSFLFSSPSFPSKNYVWHFCQNRNFQYSVDLLLPKYNKHFSENKYLHSREI